MGTELDVQQVARLRTLAIGGIEGLNRQDLDVERVAAHVLTPPVAGDLGDRGLAGVDLRPRLPVFLPTTYSLDVQAFEAALRAGLSGSLAGYAYELRRDGSTVFSGTFQDARLAGDPQPGDAAVRWSSSVRMHVASCSKLITGIAMVKALADNGVPVDSPIAPYLPRYWSRGANVAAITFAHLLNHTSGLGAKDLSASDFPLMKSWIAGGGAGVGGYLYTNLNFGLCRILVATVNGDVSPALDLPFGVNDQLWDSVTLDAYQQYVQAHVLGPAGVTDAGLTYRAGDALGYPFPRTAPGWVSGDMRSWAGGVGWHLSVDDLLRVMHALRRGGMIMPAGAAQRMLDRQFGVDAPFETLAGPIHQKTGWFANGSMTVQSLAFFLPEDLELALLANSGLGVANVHVIGMVRDAYASSLRPQYHFPADPTVVPAFVYAVEPDGDLLWYRHDGAQTGGGVATWRGPATVGVGWGEAVHVFPGGGDVVYVIDAQGRLQWYEHKGFNTGEGLETPGSWAGPREVGHGWGDVARVFSGGDGVIYVVDTSGRLIWYRHNAVADGGGLDVPGAWSGPHEVGVGWDSALHVFSTGGGVIYAVMPDGTLRWYRHNGFGDGRGLESPGSWTGPVDVGSGWAEVKAVFSRGSGVVYAVMPDGTLRWFCHDGFATGAVQWRGPVEVGTGWAGFTSVFALLPREPLGPR